jgi:hypothetical protein
MPEIELLDSVALLKNLPQKNLLKGQVGTVVEKLDDTTFEIEFTNSEGETILITPLSEKDLILLRFEVA